jgi:D-sedoheptulose 7-phosphate isomerase
MENYVIKNLTEAKAALEQLLSDKTAVTAISNAAAALIETFEHGGRAFSCGNGGSMSDAIHFAEELTGRYQKDRRPLPAVAISDPGYISCVANDYGYDHVFARYLAAHARSGDCLLAISTSGTSRNVLQAVATAKSMGVRVIGLCGRPESTLTKEADISICTPAGAFADRVQELHIKVIHTLIELVERHFFPENYR